MKGKKSVFNIIFELIIILVAILFIFPVLLTVLNSLKTDAEIYSNPASLPAHIQLVNFINAWKETKFHFVFLNTLFITLFSTIGIILVSSMAAYAMVRTRSKLSWVFFLIFTFSMVVPFQAIMVPLVVTAKTLNLKNIFGIIPIYIGLGCPMAVFMYHGFIKGIPLDLEESAAIDGAGVFRIFFTIVLPLLTPITATIMILDVLWVWNDFLLPLILLPKQSTIQLAQYGFFGQFKTEFGKALASLVLSASPIVIFYLFMQKYIIKGIMTGAVKG